MLLRTLVNYVNFGVLAAVIILLLAYPHYAGPAFYLILGWMFGSLVLIYGPWGSRRISGAAPGPGTPGAAGGTSTQFPFCIYCAAPMPVGASQCPSCHHAVSRV